MKINLVEEWKLYENMWSESKQEKNSLTEGDKEFRSEYKKLLSTPEGREKLRAMSTEERLKLYQEDAAVDPVQQILNNTSNIGFEFEGFDRERYKDKWDPNTGHYTKDWTDSYDSFTYTQDATTVFEDIRDEMIPKYIDKVEQDSTVQECKKLYDAWQSSTEETEEETGDKFELFVAQNLEDLAVVFNEYLIEKYREAAEEWAEEHREPIESKDF